MRDIQTNNMIGLKKTEVLFHTAAMGHTGASENKLDYWDMDLAPGNGVCIHMYNS